jgi:translation initiation factor 2 subunit 3
MLNPEEVRKLMGLKPNLCAQSYEQIGSLSPVSPHVIGRQATINIGTIGHVSHGKTTVVRAISGVNTIKSSEEMKNNITMKLGYANTKIYKCPKCPEPSCYKSFGAGADDEIVCPNKIPNPESPETEVPCSKVMQLLRHISFVDCPGHDNLMAIMLTGAAVMDAALLLIAGNMTCPQPQTSEHLAAVDIMNLNRIIILQNKIDLVFNREGEALKNYNEITNFIKGTKAEKSPIIPISAQFKYNIDVVLQYLVTYIPVPIRDLSSNPRFMIVRSFDVNKPGYAIEKLSGGIAGGSILVGVLKIGDEIEIRPGIWSKSAENNEVSYTPIISTIVGIKTEENELLYAIPGGLIAVGLKVDPYLTKRDALVGNLMGHKGQLPDIYITLQIKYSLLRRLIGVKTEGANTGNESIQRIAKDETLMINVGTTSMGGKVTGVNTSDGVIKVELTKGVCTSVGDKVALSRRINNKFRLIGWGEIVKGKRYKIDADE